MTENTFRRLAELGYPNTVPVIPPNAPISPHSTLYKRVGTPQDGRGKTPGVLGHDGKWRGFDWVKYICDQMDYERWHRMGAGVGIKTGGELAAVDIDTKDAALVAKIDTAAERLLGPAPCRIGNAPKCLRLYRLTEPVPYQRVEFGERDARGVPERVEILGDGRQFVAQGIHPKTGQPYRWTTPIVPFDELTVVTPARLAAFMDELRAILPACSDVIKEGGGKEVDQGALRGDPVAVRAAVAAIPNTSEHFPSRESFVLMGYAIKGAVEDEAEAFDIYSEWADRWADGVNSADLVKAEWRRMKPPYRVGAHHIFEQAEKLSGGGFTQAHAWFEEVAEPDNPFAAAEMATTRAERVAGSGRSLPVISFAEAAAKALAEGGKPLVKGLLDQGAMSVIYGASNTGKTFLGLKLAFHVASGLPFADLKVTTGRVLYVAAEGGIAVYRRLEALRLAYPGADNTRFHLIASPVDLRNPKADLQPLIDAAAGVGGVDLLVIDTLSRAMAGGDENSSVDMGALVANFDIIRKASKAHVLVVHHTGKDAAKGARGHSLLRAATDTEIEIADDQLAVTKQRDKEGGFKVGFRLVGVTLGLDSDGEPVTSATVSFEALDEAGVGKTTATERRVLEAVRVCTENQTDNSGASPQDVSDMLSSDGLPLTKTAARMHMLRLAKKGHLVALGMNKWGLKSVQNSLNTPSEQGLVSQPGHGQLFNGVQESVQDIFE